MELIVCGRMLESHGYALAVPATPAMLHWCWVRPVSSAARVGEHSGLTWKFTYFRPFFANLSKAGVLIGPPMPVGSA